ncbi:MAG: pilus assembly protein PilC [Elusimicrobia bacterium RIFCSPLOWO2_02_FULL_39_32]|nr:MAG: pilus assembly protein PilC [Elusimicrobia bacterium GWA2_38_7]OGR79498.1 MAG: pilus assembly protein PilC [Elusimicrobia bacterium RIFCSPHIGHO2_02_FULL_39_36]OGR92825.1 MAG: pilus assembly protein PilC [Elusimicrobia bacterium RIFCSPLOWO2_02_FULL_39_32]OGR99609.1 MAG: pilus assembly protein PilC [Elusimicrobia bacterium RIFCSPLOWO2_12_FULL_39_28]
MPKFIYKGKSLAGGTADGFIIAPDLNTARALLRSQKLTITELTEKTESPLDKIKSFFAPKITSKDLVLFSRQLSTLVGAGVPLVQGLNILEDQIENPPFKKVVTSLRLDIEAGMGIADSMKKYPEAFDNLYISMIRAGELGGILDIILDRLSGYLEDAEELKAKVKSAMMYPIVVLSIAIGITWFLLVFIIPKFEEMFSSFGQELPLPTKLLLGISRFLIHYWYMYVPIPFIMIFVFKTLLKKRNFAKKYDQILLKVPIFGMILKKVSVAKFTRTFSTLIKAGVPILQALDTVAQTAGNIIVEEAILTAKTSIREGERIAKPLAASKVFPTMVVSMISIGEETGNLDTMLAKIADFYENEVNAAVEGLTSMIEPLVIVFMGAVIGTIVVAMFLPMFNMSGAVG